MGEDKGAKTKGRRGEGEEVKGLKRQRGEG